MAYSRSPSYRRTHIMPGTGHTIGSVGLIVLHPKVPPIAGMAPSDRVLQVCPFHAHPPHSASSLALSARATFLCPATRPNCSIVSQQAACSTPRLPMSSFVWTPASNRSPRPLRCRSCAGRGSSSATGHSFSGEAAHSQAPVSGLRNHLLCPRRTVRHRPVLWAETRGGAIPK